MYLIIERFANPGGEGNPSFWNASTLSYESAFSAAVHAYSTIESAEIDCPFDGVVISKIHSHLSPKCSYSTYQKRHSNFDYLVVLRHKRQWVVCGSVSRRSIISQTIVSSSEWTIASLAGVIVSGRIQLNPVVKRRHNWGPVDKSCYIESLMLGLPVGQIVLAADLVELNQYSVVDGNQRLLTIAQFYGWAEEGNDFALTGLDYRIELNGLTRASISIDPILRSAADDVDNALLRVVRLQHWQDQKLLDNLTLRLNN